MRGDEENIGVQFNLYIIDSGKRKELGPSTACVGFLLTLYSRLQYIRRSFTVLSGKDSFEGHPVASLKNFTLSKGQTLTSTQKRTVSTHRQIQKPAIDINKLKTGTGPFYQTAVFTEIVCTFLYSKLHFHFYLSEEEGCCSLLSNMQPTLDISQLLTLLDI